MKKITPIKIAGLMVALVLIAFGSVSNLARTIKFALEKLLKA